MVFPGHGQDVATAAGVLLAERKLDIHELLLIRVSERGRVSDGCKRIIGDTRTDPDSAQWRSQGKARAAHDGPHIFGCLPAVPGGAAAPFAFARLDDELCRSPVAIANRMQQIEMLAPEGNREDAIAF